MTRQAEDASKTKPATGEASTATRRGDGVALWRRIVDDLTAEIAAGRFARGSRLPTEFELAERFSVNRHTVRRALSVLAESGLVRATRGSGTFVEAAPLSYPITPRTRFSEIVSRQAREPGGELVSRKIEPASAVTSDALKIAVGVDVLCMQSVRRADGVPICASTSWLPLDRVPDFDLVFAATRSITRALATFGIIDYRRVLTRVTASIATKSDENLLDLASGRPILVVESINADLAGRPIQHTFAHFAADRVQIELG